MNEGHDVWSTGTNRGKSDSINKSLRTTLRNVVFPGQLLPKVTPEAESSEAVEKDLGGTEEMEGLGTLMKLGRFKEKTLEHPR